MAIKDKWRNLLNIIEFCSLAENPDSDAGSGRVAPAARIVPPSSEKWIGFVAASMGFGGAHLSLDYS